jgi:hypothetical protein
MTDLQLVLTIIGSNIAINTLMYVAINNRINDLKDLLKSEIHGVRESILRVEGILDVRLKHLEEREKS